MCYSRTIMVLPAVVFIMTVTQISCSENNTHKKTIDSSFYKTVWVGSPASEIPYYSRKDGPLIWYGHELVANTSKYLGPKGTVMQISNGMNCQNCHLSAGTKPWGNNYGAVYSTYPKLRDRSGTIETIYKRINDCFERSLNGKALDTASKEMQAIYAYIKWVGEDVPKGIKPTGSGIEDLAYMDRSADPAKGKLIFEQKCQRCHGSNGQGAMNAEGTMYQYPPLWGPHSFTTGAGLLRLSRLAGFIKNNMPFETVYQAPQLSNEETWDVAAFVSSQPRPSINLAKDWPNLAKKPIDYPFGPYADPFSEQQHKLGPFSPIKDYREKHRH